ncbi:MAG: type-F conjugative transfer system protein TraW [Rickettsiaceae bacterium]|nr:type-F conjugative transfer system protein TraW [Rickettsiaceae bacterium]
MRLLFILLTLAATTITTIPSFANDLGEMGQVYKIKETNLLHFIFSRLNQLSKTGKIGELQQEFAKRIEDGIATPPGVVLPQALKNSTRVFNPSITLQKDIKNDKGIIVAKSGTYVNPLNYIRLSKELVFINGDRDTEIAFAKQKLDENLNNKIILVTGNIKDVNIKLGARTPVYFDQSARLINSFNIKATPSVIKQEADMLQITEVAL